MKIVVLDAKTLGDVDLAELKKFGSLALYQYTKPDDTAARISDADIIITNKVVINKNVIDQCNTLKLICVAATGMNNIDLAYAKEKGIVVKNVQGYATESVVQHTLAMIFTLLNHIPKYDAFVKKKAYSRSNIFTNHSWPIRQLSSMTIGIIGLGNIGLRMATISQALGAKVVYYSTSGKNVNQPFTLLPLEELLAVSDIVSIHAPLNEQTRHLIKYPQLKKMKPSAILVNTGRGGIIHERDLARALEEDLIAAAALDVFEQEPIAEDNPLMLITNKEKLLLSPHIAWASIEARHTLVKSLVQNIEDFLLVSHKNI
ncbi:MAG: D-2-hydroxyacid dehydrogenase [Cytophagaceae bacterium]|nr:D-2-hydroxyacid dehydrogenase [Cytophagaceae bacterium]MDW8456688.1 D-2-hydroxyacid dehydrogenase [Cytophagaceae bacterium]